MKKVIIGIVALIVLGVLYYGISPLFNKIEVDDEVPVEVASGVEKLSPEEKEEMDRFMEEVNREEPVAMNETMSEESMTRMTDPALVMGTLGHSASGTVRVIETEGQTIIRFEKFETINGPLLHLYLAKDLEANEFIDLGPIRGTKGNINYVVPKDVDLSEYRYVMHWCVPFGVLFNYADLSS